MSNEAVNKLLDLIIEHFRLKNDAALARFLSVAAPIISKMRHDRLGASSEFIIRIHETTGMPVANIKQLLGQKSLPASELAAPMLG